VAQGDHPSREITYEQRPEWLKVTIPGRRSSLLFLLYTLLLLIWAAALIGIVGYVLRVPGFGWVNIALVIFWAIIWLWFGRFLWRAWQYHAATREILFINKEQLIVRRPVSILGSTNVYDMKHVTPFYFSDKHRRPAFDYAYQHVYFGQALDERQSLALVAELNGRFFPDEDE
jgi:hypothetical protein